MKVAYFDCFNGAGGDMIVASLIDAGADADTLRRSLEMLGVGGYELVIGKVDKRGLAATRFDVKLAPESEQPHRHLKHIIEILDRSELPPAVRDSVGRIFRRLAEAEAKVHGTTVDEVHFHEVGAVDAIVDITGAVLALDLLGVERVVCSAIPVGSGTISCAHGTMPIPAPATAELLRGVPIAPTEETGELTTPTAAAVLTTLAATFGPMPAMSIESVGYGAGSRDGTGLPNVLRVMVGSMGEGDTDEIVVLETNLDDTTPEIVAYCMDRLFEAGALDVYTVPIQMKKSRPGVILAVLCEPGRAAALEQIVFAETPTLGVRRRIERRSTLGRRTEAVETPYGPIRMKIGFAHGNDVTAATEFEDCKAAAMKHGVALRVVIAAAETAWRSR